MHAPIYGHLHIWYLRNTVSVTQLICADFYQLYNCAHEDFYVHIVLLDLWMYSALFTVCVTVLYHNRHDYRYRSTLQ